ISDHRTDQVSEQVPERGSRSQPQSRASTPKLSVCGWYWGPMTWEDAEAKLKEKPDGSFLVRDSSDPRYILSLSFRSQNITHHTRMEHYRVQPHHYLKHKSRLSEVKLCLPPTPVQLLYPVSRFSSVKTLQHLCRFYRDWTGPGLDRDWTETRLGLDHIQELPLPT
uniref:Suppressor of cytokine signaling 7 n=1 Tax=Periophthalmus magnuspinnatus TaxID=409849 RepID=A0A3B3Z9C4_9GOBI